MTTVDRMVSALLLSILIAWIGSYIAFRYTATQPGQTVGVHGEYTRLLADIYAPLADVDEAMTGERLRFE